MEGWAVVGAGGDRGCGGGGIPHGDGAEGTGVQCGRFVGGPMEGESPGGPARSRPLAGSLGLGGRVIEGEPDSVAFVDRYSVSGEAPLGLRYGLWLGNRGRGPRRVPVGLTARGRV